MSSRLGLLGGWVVLGLVVGCGGGGGSSKSVGTTAPGGGSGGGANPPAPTAFEVVRSEPTHGAQPAAVSQVRLVFNRALDPSTVVLNPQNPSGSTLLVVQQPSGAQAATALAGSVAASGTEILFTPSVPFASGVTYGVALTSAVRDTGGVALSTGSVSGPRTLNVPNLVFQATFTPTAVSGGGGGQPSGTPQALVSAFAIEPGSDVWFIDIDTLPTLTQDLRDRGLATGSASTDAWALFRLYQKILSYTSNKYLRNDDGSGVSGQSYAISFIPFAPAGRAGRDFNRHVVGGQGPNNTLGISFYDPGNRDLEDNSPQNGTGVFSSSIDGRFSTLTPRLQASEARFVDGTYRLGQGSATEDARFLAVQEALMDYGKAIGIVLAHEVGHSVGLDHDRDGSTSIMSATLSERMLSDPAMRFRNTSINRLNRDLGFTP